MSVDYKNKSSIWDGLPEDWGTEMPANTSEEPPKKEIKVESSIPPTQVPGKPILKEEKQDSDDARKIPASETGHKKKKKEKILPVKKRKFDKKKFQEFEKRSQENRYNSSEKTKKAYQKEKTENRNDFIILGAALVLVIIGIVVFVVLFTGTSNQRIYDLIDAGNYSTAYHNIEERYESGKDVDSLIYEFADSCVNHEEYKRAVASLDMLSENAVSHADFFTELVEKLIAHGKANRAAEVINFMYERGGALSEKADELLAAYDVL